MALQSSGQLKLSEIANELGESLSNVSLGGMTDSSTLTPIADKSVSNFYGYSAGGTSFLAGARQTSSGFACFQGQTVTFYHNGSGSDPVTNDYVYSDSAMTTIVTSGYYRKDTIAFEWFRTNGFGRIYQSGMC